MPIIKHKYITSKPNGAHADRVQPSHWNEEHDVVWTDSDYPLRSFRQIIKIRNEGTQDEYIEILWEEII